MKNPDLTYRTLCRLLSSPADAALASTLGPDDWRLLAAAARREGVAPLLYHILKEQKNRGAGVQGRTGKWSLHLWGSCGTLYAELEFIETTTGKQTPT